MEITCSCGKKLRVNDALAGKRVKCPGCGRALTVGESAGLEEAPLEPPEPQPKRTRSTTPAIVADEEEPEDGDEPEEPPPQSKGKKKNGSKKASRKRASSSAGFWVTVGGGVLLLVAVIVLGVVLVRNRNKGSGGGAQLPAQTGGGAQQPTTLAGYTGVENLAVSADGGQVATHRNGEIKLWDLHSGKVLMTLDQPHKSLDLAISPNGKLLVSSSSTDLKVWDLATGKIVKTEQLGRGGNVGFSPDNQLAYCFVSNQGVVMVNVATGAVTWLAKDKQFPTAAAFSPTDSLVAVSISSFGGPPLNLIQIYDPQTGKEVTNWFLAVDFAYSLAFSSDGKVLASGSRQKIAFMRISPNHTTLMSSGAPKPVDTAGKNPTMKIALGPGAKFLAGLDLGNLTVWDTTTGSHKDLEQSTCLDMAFAPDGSLLVSSRDKPLGIVDPATWTSRAVP